MSEFGKWLKRRRQEKRLNQHDLTKLSGVSTHMISVYERGNRLPQMAVTRKLARALDEDASTLMKIILNERDARA